MNLFDYIEKDTLGYLLIKKPERVSPVCSNTIASSTMLLIIQEICEVESSLVLI